MKDAASDKRAYAGNWKISGLRPDQGPSPYTTEDVAAKTPIYLTDEEADPLLRSGSVSPLVDTATLIAQPGRNFARVNPLHKSDAFGPNMPAFEVLFGAGYLGLTEVRAASDEELLRLPGIGPATLKKIRAFLNG